VLKSRCGLRFQSVAKLARKSYPPLRTFHTHESDTERFFFIRQQYNLEGGRGEGDSLTPGAFEEMKNMVGSRQIGEPLSSVPESALAV
jgi:hypothetical protein